MLAGQAPVYSTLQVPFPSRSPPDSCLWLSLSLHGIQFQSGSRDLEESGRFISFLGVFHAAQGKGEEFSLPLF